jgi:hypothetical protein
MLEKEIEKKVSLYAKNLGWLTYKFVSPACRGVPDRIFIKDGQVIFIEFKAGKNKCTPLQYAKIEDLRSQGMKVYIINNVDDGKTLFDDLKGI